MEILKQSGLPRPRIGGMGAASASNFPSTEYQNSGVQHTADVWTDRARFVGEQLVTLDR